MISTLWLPVTVVSSMLLFAAGAVEFPQWRGLNRDGIVSLGELKWPEKLERRWSVTVGEGHSSPLLGDGKLFVFAREGGQEQAVAIDPANGKVLWRQSYQAPYRASVWARSHGAGPKATPVYGKGRLYTLGFRGILSAWDAGEGKLLWRKDFAAEIGDAAPQFGASSSPLLEGGLLIVQAGGAKGALLALDAASGKENWRWKGDSSAYSSPVIGTFGGTKQVVFLTADQVVGVDLSNGTLAWKTPLRTSMMQSNMMTPVIADGTVIYSGENKGVTAARPKRDQNGAWSLEQVWHNAEVSFTMSSPVRTDRLLFGMTPRNKGQLVCLDPTSGKTLWKGPPRQGENAALLLLDTFLLTLTNEGQLILMKPSGDSYQEVRRHQVANTETWAHPIPTAQGVIVKDLDSVALWQ